MALLIAAEDVIGAKRAASLGRLRYGRVATGDPLPHCQIVGFPQIQRYGEHSDDLDYDQYRVSVLPMAGQMRGSLVCELHRSAAEERGYGPPPLGGLSGAPVFAGPVLLGVVTEVPRDRHHLRIGAVKIEALRERDIDFPLSGLRGALEQITDVHPQDEQFEARYAKDLESQYRKTEIFGIEELGRSESRWDLDTAYLSLRAEDASDMPEGEEELLPHAAARSVSRRIENLLTERPRALLRGEAGAGKTTLVWWLAAHAAAGTLGEELAELNVLVPFVIPLREVHARGGRFPSVAELLIPGRGITDDPPDGWTRRVLEAGRGLLLVDGLDEVPATEREEARRWLSALLDRYPATRCLATVRPNAVDKGWLSQERFDELTLLPMSDEDIHTFVNAWHNAARLESGHFYDARRADGEQELLTSLEQDLVYQLERNTALRDLARTPLLCAVICALHRRRRGLLPTTRWSLYRAALAMLLGGRDAGRGVLHADPVRLDSDDQHALLQRLAIWLVRTGQQQLTREQAVHQLGFAMRDMLHLREQGTPERILRFLLDRSGLLQERGDGAIQFIHRTFQDFLAAKEFHESGYIPELLEHAHNEAWRDVIVLAVGHTSRPVAERLIHHLVTTGDAAIEGVVRYGLHLLAARCAITLRQMHPGLMEEVKRRVGARLPPQNDAEVDDIASLGDWVLEVPPFPGAEGALVTRTTVRLLARIGSAKATQRLKWLSAHLDPHIRSEVAKMWDLRPLQAYADEVLAGMHVPNLRVDHPVKLANLPSFASVTQLTVIGSYSSEELATQLPVRNLVSLKFFDNQTMSGLGFLRGCMGLTRLELHKCMSVRDLSALSDLRLTHLWLVDQVGDLAPHPCVRELAVSTENTAWLEDLAAWPNLETLIITGYNQNATGILRAAFRTPRLTQISLGIDSLGELAQLNPNPHIQVLTVPGLRDHAHIGLLRHVFPGLRSLQLGLVRGGPTVLDLRDLLDLPGLVVELWGEIPNRADIAGADVFGDRLRCDKAKVRHTMALRSQNQ
ncbi:NACHT domain-containing protein [Streptomyces sp. NPDC002685]|uniref:NACHT domain-containing protein n=1 Tax=Streptomyces sp. NPDC002685 TaxID=3154540 RepID=UPI00332097F2